jgi:hypothetical protein
MYSIGIGMQTTEEIRDTEIGEENKGKIYHTENMVDDRPLRC